MGEQAVQASWSRQVGQVGPAYCPRAYDGRGPGTSVTGLGPPRQAIYWSPFLGSWAPQGAPFRGRAWHSGGCPAQREPQRHLHVKGREGGIYCILSQALKHSCGGPLSPAFLQQRKEAGPALAEQPHKAIATRDSQTRGTHRPAAAASKCAHKPRDPVKVRIRPSGLKARGSGPGGLSEARLP